MVRGIKRSAFTLIELIFAIVVMSIVVISLPIMMRTTSRAIEDNIVQEAIFAASAELMGATTFDWDRNSMLDFQKSNASRVIDVDGDCNIERLRPGHIAEPYHRRCLDNNASTTDDTTAANTADATFPNLENAQHTAATAIFEGGLPEAQGYKNDYKSIVTVSYPNNNVKQITSRITDSSDHNLTVLKTFCANIGEIDYYKRRF